MSIFWPKNAGFLQKNADISKIKVALVPKVIFSETAYECVLTCQISSFRTSFRQGEVISPPSPPQNKPLKKAHPD